MSTSRLLEFSRRLDTTLNEFALTADANGQYPWQAAQQKREQRRRVGGALVGAAAIGAGAYGAKKLNARYGTTGADGMRAGAADLINRADDKFKAGYGKAKDAVGAGMAKAKTAITAGATRAGAYGSKILKAGQQGYKQSGLKGAGSLAMRALRKVRFNRAEVLVELEAKLDGALQEFADSNNNLIMDLPDDYEHKEITIDRHGRVVNSKLLTKKRRSGEEAEKVGGSIQQKGDTMVLRGHDSPSRIRRAKAVAGMAATGAAGYLAGKHGGKVMSRAKAMIKRRAA